MGNLIRRLENLEKNTPTPGEDEEQIQRGIRHRIFLAITEELGDVRAPRFISGQKDPRDRIGKSLIEELYGPAYTEEQYCTLAVRRAFDRLEEILSPGYCTGDNYLQYLNEEDLSPQGRERAAQKWIEAMRLDSEETWTEVNKWERERREKALREEWEV
jgi:hypothetical protein